MTGMKPIAPTTNGLVNSPLAPVCKRRHPTNMTGGTMKYGFSFFQGRCDVRFLRVAAIAALGLALPVSAAAQDFGVMNSAETINKGNFKLMANPIVVFGKNGSDGDTGVAVMGGYGFGDRFDVEAKISFFDGLKFFGADAEYWLIKENPVNVSLIGGFHIADASGGSDAKGIDITALASGKVGEKLELYGGLDWSRNSFKNSSFHYSTFHLVPGIEYRISPQVDFVGEFGLGLNDDSNHYASVGIAYYFRAR